MTETLISLISIAIGIIGAHLTGFYYKKKSFGLTGNTLAGVFGSAFLIKTFGRLGFGPTQIMETGKTNLVLLSINFIISFIGGVIIIFLLRLLHKKISKSKK